ncbi:hypothetical protein NM688_g3621 [Phlebia brevispora]|uniref:Uncharacterized protein n=1 Tax=Phlebia brevispora TaxID=194682 RepID=A0ACC1T580_9APHY|nr:hypothetical protein NM688_g3621 [Phlebia brevispora]
MPVEEADIAPIGYSSCFEATQSWNTVELILSSISSLNTRNVFPPYAASHDASMANIDTLDSSVQLSREEGVNGGQEEKGAEGSSKKQADEVAAVSKSSSPTKDATPALPSPGSGLVPLRGSSANGLTPGSSGAPTLSMPHPKKFSHSDINKRFLEKNSPGSSASQTPSTPSIKPGSTIRSLQQSLPRTVNDLQLPDQDGHDHHQLALPQAPPQSAGPTSKPSPGSAPGNATLPLPAPVGKVIQPQPRGAAETSISRKDSGIKPAWGAAPKAPPPIVGNPDLVSDFPTAAEVAQVRSAKILEKKQAAQEATAQKEALAAEADAFRGVHLAPNAHHWDEDEGDDSNFLDEVIEFDDGRQYTIPHQAEQNPDGILTTEERKEAEDQPVSKEERFADDFDRSWPRSRTSGPPVPRGQPHLSPSTTSSMSMHSPQDSSRVLFNERSNRLEPYASHSQSRFSGPPKDSYISRRGSRSEYVSSPTELRGGRDAPPHTQGLQLLQRPGQGSGFSDEGSRHRGYGDHPGFGPWHENRPRDRDMPRRDYPGSPHMARPFSQAFDHSRPRDHYNQPSGMDRPRRYSNMGQPPSSPLSVESELRDGRQLPPHLSGSQGSSQMWRSPSSEAAPRQPSTLSVDSQSVASRSPAASHASLSPLHVDTPLQAASSGSPLVDLEEARKAAMHSAAERAKLRRQAEEAKREEEKERARKKAAEIEAKMKAAEAAKEKEREAITAPPDGPDTEKFSDEAETKVGNSNLWFNRCLTCASQAIEFIEHAVSSIAPRSEAPEKKLVQSPRVPFARVPSVRGGERPNFPRGASLNGHNGDDTSLTGASSWRTKAAPPRTQPPAPAPAPQQSAVPLPDLPLLAEVESFNIGADESVEVVDFADHGKLVGAPERAMPAPEQRLNGPSSRPPRPVATDFFDEQTAAPRAEEASWRRKTSVPAATEQVESQLQNVPKDRPSLEITPAPYEPSMPSAHWKGQPVPDGRPPEHPQGTPYNHTTLRSPTTPSYREAPMSALNDTMARIKGALDGMHTKTEQPKKWVPPAMRERPAQGLAQIEPVSGLQAEEHIHREVFDVTGYEPPRSPKPAWNHFRVRLPHNLPPIEPIHPKKLRMFFAPSHMRLRVYSLAPPIEGTHKRDFNLTEYLFRKPIMSKGRVRYIVSLPGSRSSGTRQALFKHPGPGPVVNLPTTINKAPSYGAFGRPSEADGATSWRRAALPAAAPSTAPAQLIAEESPRTLDTVSRSPPPEVPSQKVLEKHDTAVSPPVSVPAAKARSQPKLPEGSSVAFYRDSRVNSSETQPKTTVNFIVSSELEEDLPRVNGAPEQNGGLPPPQTVSSGLIATTQESAIIPESCSSVNDPIVEFHKGNHSPIHAPITPRTQTGKLPWAKSPKEASTKDAPVRAADATEHLKTVWSTTANQSEKPSSTILEEFPSDLVAPVPVRDTKLEQTVATSTHIPQ